MLKNNFIYFDNAATTKPDDDIFSLYEKVEKEIFANPNSVHHLGLFSDKYLNNAREMILSSFKVARSHKIIFTSSSTEANNIAIKGYALKYQNRGKHLITSNIEHPSVLECFKQLEELFGFEVTYLKANGEGVIELDELKKAMRDDTILVSIMAMNNEIGSINNIDEIANIVHKNKKAVLHVDTTQSIGKLELNYQNIDMFVASSHKLASLKGSGALIYRKNLDFIPLISGGGQEYGIRSGTQAVALDVCLAKSIQKQNQNIAKKIEYITTLNEYLRNKLSSNDEFIINSSPSCSPYILNFSLKSKKAAVVVEALSRKNIYVSSVSACHSKHENYSYVVYNLKNDLNIARNTIRISFSMDNNKEEIDVFIDELNKIIGEIK